MRTVLLVMLTLVALGCQPTRTAAPLPAAPAPAKTEVEEVLSRAPELEGGVAWLNVNEPPKLADLRGHVVVLDFWTYCCINCLHVLPELARLERKFKSAPVHVIGVHSGKFDAEKDASRIRTAMARHHVAHPVVVDDRFGIWKRFDVQAWPTLVIIDTEGNIAHRISGEPKPGALEAKVAALLERGKNKGTLATVKKAIATPPVTEAGPLSYPGKVAVSPSGVIAVADSSHHRIVLLDPSGQVRDVAGTGIAGSADGGFDQAAFRYPQGMVFSGSTLYVADTENHQVRALDLEQRTVSTIAGTGKKGEARRGGRGLDTALRSPWALALDDKRLFVAMAGSHQIWVHDLDAGNIAVFAGSGVENIDDGTYSKATFSQPSGLTMMGNKLFVADSEVSAVRRVDLDEERVDTVVGTGLFDFGDVDGVGNAAKLQHALGIVARGEMLFVADTFNNKLKRIDPATRTVTTLAGGSGELAEPGGLALMNDGRVLIADTNHHRLQTFDPVSGALEPFAIVGLEPPAGAGLVLADGVGQTGGPALSVKATGALRPGKGTLLIEARAPAGAKLTDGAPMVAEARPVSGASVRTVNERTRTQIRGGQGMLKVEVVAEKSGTLELEVSFYWCTTGDEQACHPSHAVLSVQVDVSPDGGAEARLVFAATR